MIFRKNYLHDNRCQGFFIKDGRAFNVTVEDNLIVRNSVPSAGQGQPSAIGIYDTYGLTLRNNTLWNAGSPATLRECSFTTVGMDHNVLEHFWPGEQATCVKAKTMRGLQHLQPARLLDARPALADRRKPGLRQSRSRRLPAQRACQRRGRDLQRRHHLAPQDQQYGP